MSKRETLSDEMAAELEELMRVAAEEIAEQMEAFAAQVHDTQGDDEFTAWFLWMVAQYGPEWAMALEAKDAETGEALVEGGERVLKRWLRIIAGLTGQEEIGAPVQATEAVTHGSTI